jgi:hypothetical protein
MGFFNGIWLVVAANPSEKYEFVSWDDDIPNIWKKNVPNHQPVFLIQIAQSGQLSSATFGHTYSTVDGCEILHQLVGLSRYNPTTDRVS